ncbi:redoxin domain-containing protein [Brevibacillus thermoruber]|uniref:redoxin domain-containing protein n=1 Tax=Brevibacillus thermoruber TaxID=33942 RepID=UPI00068FE4CC|nr:redoxin domain-containing protein [Brevibacillus thermoruber]
MRVIQALYKYALPSTDGVRVSCGELLRDANGLVLVSFPFAFTETSEQALAWFRDHYSQFAEKNYRVVGLSVENVFTLKALREKLHLPYHLYSDANREVSRSLGILLPEVAGVRDVTDCSVLFVDRLRHIRRWTYGGGVSDFERIQRELVKSLVPFPSRLGYY